MIWLKINIISYWLLNHFEQNNREFLNTILWIMTFMVNSVKLVFESFEISLQF